jgi:hypothetical protein
MSRLGYGPAGPCLCWVMATPHAPRLLNQTVCSSTPWRVWRPDSQSGAVREALWAGSARRLSPDSE